MVYDENREKHEKIDIDKDKDIDGYVSKYADIINAKLELVNRIGELLYNLMADVQNVVDMVRETDNKILIHDTLTNNLKKWKDAILEFICKDNVCIKPDIKMKDTPVTKKKDTPVTKKKYTKKKDTKPVTKKKDTKPVTKKKYTPVTKKKDTRDTDKNILLKIIRNNIKVLNWINTNL